MAVKFLVDKWSVLEAALLAAALVVLIVLVPPPRIGRGDFIFNWTAGYLLAHGENIYDPALTLQVQRNYTDIYFDYPLITLSPPWVALLMVPFALFSFDRAAWLWVVSNIFITCVSAILVWRNVALSEQNGKRWWIGILTAFLFVTTLNAILVGQTTIFVLGMTAAFLVFEKKGSDEWAGIACAGMLVKPQMVFFTLLLVGLRVFQTRRWRMLLGFGAAAILVCALLFLLRTGWLGEYRDALLTLNALAWESSNLGGLLLMWTGWSGAKFIGLAILPVVLWFWARYGKQIDALMLVNVGVLLSVIAAPYGFSYDQVILVIPLVTLIAWITERRLGVVESMIILLSLVFADAILYYQRVLTPSEVYFFWVPLALAVVYAYAWARRSETAYA